MGLSGLAFLGLAIVMVGVGEVWAEQQSTDVKVKLDAVISIAADANLDLNVMPAPAGVFVKKTGNVTVSTNNATGYILQVADKDSDTNLKHEMSGVTAQIPSITGNTIEANFTMNRWGIALDAINFQPIPTAGNALTVPGTATGPVNAETKQVTFGAKVNTEMSSGAYADVVMFSAVTNYVPTPTFSGITTMQQMTTEICNAETKPTKEATQSTTDHTEDNNLVPETTLTDTRDGKSYIIRKLADGNCWMSQNLALSTSAGQVLTEADTDLMSGRTFTAPAASVEGDTWANNGSDGPHYLEPKPEFAYIQNGTTPSSTGQPIEATGNYYDWIMATAGAKAEDGTSLISASSDDANAADSICPKGWRLPQEEDKSYKNLIISTYNIPTNSDASLLATPFNFLRSGNYYIGGKLFYKLGKVGLLWTSKPLNQYKAYNLLFEDSGVDPQSHSWKFMVPISVRCVAR